MYPPSGEITTPLNSTDISPPIPPPEIVAIQILGLLATYGIAPSVIPQNPVMMFATAGFLSSASNFCGNNQHAIARAIGGTIHPATEAAKQFCAKIPSGSIILPELIASDTNPTANR